MGILVNWITSIWERKGILSDRRKPHRLGECAAALASVSRPLCTSTHSGRRSFNTPRIATIHVRRFRKFYYNLSHWRTFEMLYTLPLVALYQDLVDYRML